MVTYIGFAHIRPLKVVLTLIGGFTVVFTAWSNSTAVENRLVGKTIFSLVVTHIGFAHIRPLKVVLTLIGGFRVVLPPGRILPRFVLIHLLSFSRRSNFFKWVLPAGKIFDCGQKLSHSKAHSQSIMHNLF